MQLFDLVILVGVLRRRILKITANPGVQFRILQNRNRVSYCVHLVLFIAILLLQNGIIDSSTVIVLKGDFLQLSVIYAHL